MANGRHYAAFQFSQLLWLGIILLFASSVIAATDSDVISEYQKREGRHKAIAISGNGPRAISSMVYSKASPAVASISALARCEAKRLALRSANYCEIRATNNSEVTTAQKIRAGVPDQHPLFLWKLASNKATVYLAGTIHVLKQSLYPLPQQYQSAFDSSDSVVVEVDTMSTSPEDVDRFVNTYFLLPKTQSIEQVLNESQKALLSEFLRYRNSSIEAVHRLKPSMLAIQLSLNQLVALGYSQEYGVEKFFLKQVGPRNILQLETLEQQFQLLGSAPMTLQRELLMDSIIRIDEIDTTMAALTTAWLSGDALSFEALTQSMSSESPEYLAFSQKLLDERNAGMANKIDGYLDSEGTYFVMLGAAHLVGKNNVLSLLRRLGRTAIQMHSGER